MRSSHKELGTTALGGDPDDEEDYSGRRSGRRGRNIEISVSNPDRQVARKGASAALADLQGMCNIFHSF